MKKGFILNLVICIVFAVSMSFLYFAETRQEKKLAVSSFGEKHTVIIDAGHGGEDGGAVGMNGLLEKDINLQISKRLELLLNFAGINTDMTRRDDISLNSDGLLTLRRRKASDINKRVEQVVNTPNAVLISVHQNSFPQDITCHGAQVFFSTNNVESEVLAEHVQQAIIEEIDTTNTRTKKEIPNSVYLMKKVNCPAILIECGFLTNNEELNRLSDGEYQKKLAAGILSGYLKYKKSGLIQ